MKHSFEPPIRVMALHALAYCERLFYLEEVEEIRLADANVFAGRTLHLEIKIDEDEKGILTSYELESEKLGLVGKVDCIKRRDGSLIPFEHKKGRSRRLNGKTMAWPSDALQVCAYGMMLEEELGEVIPEGRVRYHQENISVRVPLDDQARDTVIRAIKRAKELRQSAYRPPVTDNDRLCIKCSLAPICLPEEERIINKPAWEAIRLFPADRELKTIYINDYSAKISRSKDQLKIEANDIDKRLYPIHEIGSLVLQGYPQITTQALHFCARHEISIHWISPGGKYVTGLVNTAGSVQRRIRQFKALSDPEICLSLARKLVMAKVEGTLKYILRSTRGTTREESGVKSAIDELKKLLKQIAKTEKLESLRGYEGMSGQIYFSVLPALLRGNVPVEMRYVKRSRRPPRDRFNALLSFGYSLVYQSVFQAIVAVGLEPALGFFHTPRSSAHPLVLDLMELFRLAVWDIPLIGSINRLHWDSQDDFDVAGNRVWLSASGRKKAIRLFENRLTEKWKHPVINYSLSYARLMELETRLLEKEWSGQPGLFARMRLR